MVKMSKWIGEFVAGFLGGVKGFALVMLTIAAWGIVLVGSWWVLLWLIKSTWGMVLALMAVL